MANRKPRSYPNLETWRDAQGLNQRDAADLLGISQSVYARLEGRKRFVKGKLAADITAKTRVPLEVLVGAA